MEGGRERAGDGDITSAFSRSCEEERNLARRINDGYPEFSAVRTSGARVAIIGFSARCATSPRRSGPGPISWPAINIQVFSLSIVDS